MNEILKVTAYVPVKKNSERVANKNFRNFNGRPLYEWIFLTLDKIASIETVVVNTDSEILIDSLPDLSGKIRIIRRDEKLLGDHVVMNELFAADLDELAGEHFLQTHCTNPLLTAATIHQAIEKYFEAMPRHDSLFTVSEIRKRAYRSDLSPVNHQTGEMKMTQHLDPVLIENSNLFLFSRSSFLNAGKNRIGLKPQSLVMNDLEGMDIDYEEDFLLAEMVHQNRERFIR